MTTAFVVGTSLLAFVAGFALASPITISSSIYSGEGNMHSGGFVTWWLFVAVDVGAIPVTVPSAANATSGSPTVLSPTANSYVLNAATSGHKAVFWEFNETTSAPRNTELGLVFSVTNGSGGTNTTTTVYVETQGAAPGSTLTFRFYFDSGLLTASLAGELELTVECMGLGTCG
jgi:hypothetical protein